MSKFYDFLHDIVERLNFTVRFELQSLSQEQKEIARSNIGAAASDNVVMLTDQTLTDEQKKTARINIGAQSADDLALPEVTEDDNGKTLLVENGEWKMVPSSGGISAEASVLLLSILGEALYTSDQSGNILKLKELLESGADEPDVPVEPDVPDPPVVLKLEAPVIRLETVAEPDEPDVPDEPVIPEGNTPAILGVAILGKTILGQTGGSSDRQKLNAPVIRLVTVDDNAQKLVAPVIQLVTMPDPEDPEEPDPVTPKLDAPAIRLETVTEPDLPIIPKLGTPTIYLETIVEPEPEDPMLEKLYAPTIRLETALEPEPEEPVWPQIRKLATPAISLDLVFELKIDGDYLVWDEIARADGYALMTNRPGNDGWAWDYLDGNKAPISDYNSSTTIVKVTAYYVDENGNKLYFATTNQVTIEPDKKLEAPEIHLEVPHTHEYVSAAVEPTCIERGQTTHTCTVCGDSYADSYVSKLGHDYGDYVKTSTEGLTFRECSRCNKQEFNGIYHLMSKVELDDSMDAEAVWDLIYRAKISYICRIQDEMNADGYSAANGYVTWYYDPKWDDEPIEEHSVNNKAVLGTYTYLINGVSDFSIDGYKITTVVRTWYEGEEPTEELDRGSITLTKEKPVGYIMLIIRYSKYEKLYFIGDAVYGSDDVDVIRSLYPAPNNGDWVKVLDENGQQKRTKTAISYG